MVWGYRPGQEPEEQIKNIEKDLGLDNLRDLQLREEGGTMYLYIYRSTRTFKVALTEVL